MNENIIFSFNYSGLFTHKFLEESVDKFEKEVMPLFPSNIFKLFLFCTTEFIQNIGFYSSSRGSTEDGKEYGIGSINIEIDDNEIKIISINKVTPQQFEKILSKISYLNTLSKDELKQLKKEKLRSAQEDDSKGGGIGFIEIIRRSESPIIMNQELADDENLKLELLINYKSGESNG